MVASLAIWGNRRALRPAAIAAGGVFLAMAALFTLDQTLGFPVAANCREEGASARLAQTTMTLVRGAVGEEGVTAGLTADPAIATRLLVARAGLRGFLERPILGWGPENFDKVFDRFADASFYQYTDRTFDQPHNKVVEELSTKGALGTLAYFALWAALVLAVIRRRPPRGEALAYAILGALAGYFVQNLFLFDMPAMMLQWALMVAWVAGQDQAPEAVVRESGVERQAKGLPTPLQRLGSLAFRAISSRRWGRMGLATSIAVLLGLSLYFMNYRPYAAARSFLAFFQGQETQDQYLAMVQRSIKTFPGLATLPRQVFFELTVFQWQSLSSEERERALDVLVPEAFRAFEAEPRNARLLMSALPVFQAASSPQGLERVEPLVQRLKELAPLRVQTHQRLATQEFLKGNYRAAIQIIEDFEALAPETEPLFLELKKAAQEALKGEGG